MTREAFENAIAVASALGASTNCPPHLIAIARHTGIDLGLEDWQRIGEDVPLLVNCMPAGKNLGEGFHRAGRSEEHTSELQSLMRISYAVFCLKKKKKKKIARNIKDTRRTH